MKPAIFYKERRDVLCAGLKPVGPGMSGFPKELFFIWTKVPAKGVSSADFVVQPYGKKPVCRLLREPVLANLGEGYVRIALTRDCEVMKEAVCPHRKQPDLFIKNKTKIRIRFLKYKS